MARYQVILAYDGTHFFGFQRQAPIDRTVQAVVEEALTRLGWKGGTILAAGRTDTGVHAAGQVIAFDLNWKHPMEELQRALNAQLPDDVAVRSVREAEADFHPRYGAVSRWYQYHILLDANRNPLAERYAWRIASGVDVAVLRSAAAQMIGTHDFAAFGTPPRSGGSTVRTVLAASWHVAQEQLIFEVGANAFLYHMVRRMVFLQLKAAEGKIAVADLLDKQKTDLLPGLAPGHGLTFYRVEYPEVQGN